MVRMVGMGGNSWEMVGDGGKLLGNCWEMVVDGGK